ncbi:hypothetical protein K08M4_12330 [Vibrio syngnathi]|uniref:Uncharacterized protein n=1 Tax=Vibrio syngnathi TaxID=3034029 RepID=A0AA34TNE1_9VIBR|nr:hypothetical protein K08M4_12330 [Vibrio syngnathi]
MTYHWIYTYQKEYVLGQKIDTKKPPEFNSGGF